MESKKLAFRLGDKRLIIPFIAHLHCLLHSSLPMIGMRNVCFFQLQGISLNEHVKAFRRNGFTQIVFICEKVRGKIDATCFGSTSSRITLSRKQLETLPTIL